MRWADCQLKLCRFPVLLICFAGILFTIKQKYKTSNTSYNLPNKDASFRQPASLFHCKQGTKFPYTYLAMPERLFKFLPTPLVISYIRSAPNEFKERNQIRNSWGSKLIQENIPVIFVIGKSTEDPVNQILYNEALIEKDILMTNLQDHYLHLTLKMWTVFHFHSFCLLTSYQPVHVFWGNSDTLVNPESFKQFIKLAPTENYIAGSINSGVKPSRDIRQQWYVPKEVFPPEEYPPYVIGCGVFQSNNVFLKLANLTEHTNPSWMQAFTVDDALINGEFRAQLKIPLKSCSPFCCDYYGCAGEVCERWNRSLWYHAYKKAEVTENILKC